ncbi:MAG TPA: hypothetical protein VGP08_20590 [Pyrinomonadaceae bacterium]|nr:hypothetical protein [Pyrinomonadaceae bacterium]
MATLAVKQLQLAPLGAGDLIDRTVRLYRHHFMTLIRVSALPVIISAAGSVTYSVSAAAMSATARTESLAVYTLFMLLGLAVLFLGLLAQLIVMGGASRNLVMHLLRGEPVTARLIYRSVRTHFRSLLGASLLVALWLMSSAAIAMVALFFVMMLAFVVIAAAVAAAAAAGLQWVTVIVALLIYLAGVLLALVVLFYLAGRVAYVPQVLVVEGRTVVDAMHRSNQLARGNVRRLMGMFMFTTFASYSALMLLFVPLLWFAYFNGLDLNPFSFDAARAPAWYTISLHVVRQLSAILLAPVWMMGLSLLYVDERVRQEGYDIELLAAQRLGSMPELPTGYKAPLTPAIAEPVAKEPHAAVGGRVGEVSEGSQGGGGSGGARPGSVLGL